MDQLVGRRRFLRAGAGVAAGFAMGLSTPLARVAAQAPTSEAPGAGSSGSPIAPGLLRILTSPDHWDPGVLRSLAADRGVTVRVTPLTDDASAFTDVGRGEVVADVITGEGGWIAAYHAAGLTQPLDLSRIDVAQELFPLARTMDLLLTPEGMLGYPWSWSPLQVVYDPARVDSAPDSWEVLVDPRHRGRVVIEEQRMDLVLCAARAVGAQDPLAMTDAELAAATDWLTQLRPNIGRIVHHRGGVIDALATGECALAISSLGAPDLVKDAGGPEVVAFVPKEGTIGSIEAEMVSAGSANLDRVPAYLDAEASAEASAAAFLSDGRPLFNELARRLLVDSGHGDRVRRYLYDRPEVALEMTLSGPGARPDAYLAAASVILGDR
jgi:spermidine/putrescine-binding protein